MARKNWSYLKSFEDFWRVFRTEAVNEDFFTTLGKPDKAALPNQNLTATVWNVFKGAAGPAFFWDYHCLAQLSDLMILQEALVDRQTITNYILKSFELLHSASYKRRDGMRDGLITASRCPMVNDPQRILSKFSEPVVNTVKSALVSFYPIENRAIPLMVINLHSTLFRSAPKATQEMEHIFQHLPEHTGPVLFGGDFNTVTPKFFNQVVEVLHHHGFHHVVTDNDPRSDFRILDHIFVRNIIVKSIAILEDVKTSDHYPIQVKLSL